MRPSSSSRRHVPPAVRHVLTLVGLAGSILVAGAAPALADSSSRTPAPSATAPARVAPARAAPRARPPATVRHGAHRPAHRATVHRGYGAYGGNPYGHHPGYAHRRRVLPVVVLPDAGQVTTGVGYAAQSLYPEPLPPPPPVVVVVQAPAPSPPPAPRVEPAPRPTPPPRVRSTEPGELWLDVSPLDADIYLDDRRVGTAADVGSLEEPLVLSPGVYVLEIRHPDYASERLVFAVEGETPATVEIDLARSRSDRRSRVTTPRDLPGLRPAS